MSYKIKFYNSLTKKEEDFNPVHKGKVRIYNCGPTVYKRQHIGNMRRFLFADFLRRSMEFLGYRVNEVTNITDVGHLTQDDIEAGEDKIEKEAARNKTSPQQIANQETKLFLSDLKLLNIQPSHKYPRATKHIKEMQDLISTMIDKDFAYVTDVGVFFDISKFNKYGELSGNTVDMLADGTRLAVRPEKRNPGDFALWLTDKTDQLQQWDSPWGRGYPGWHIECSAMSLKYLGDEIDIHTGGEDNKFPHHENEIAQSEAATGNKFAHTWMHNAHLQMSGKKLAKREGQQLTLDTVIEKGYSPATFRLMVFGSHYRTKIEFSWEKMDKAKENLKTITRFLNRLQEITPRPKPPKYKESDVETINKFSSALADDLNTPDALAVVYDYIKQINKKLDEENITKSEVKAVWNTIIQIDHVLGLVKPILNQDNTDEVQEKLTPLLREREKARKNGDFEQADKLRKEIESHGYLIKDTKNGASLEKE
jgi:cysteinyl-tRNA synthetase